MNFRASAVQLLLKYDRAYIQAKAIAPAQEVHGDNPAGRRSERRAILSFLAHLSERLVGSKHCNPRMARAIINSAITFAERRPDAALRQALIDAFIQDVRMLIEAERRGRERPEHDESRIVVHPWWGPLPGESMIYEANTTHWNIGDLVIHDADAKKPEMLMRVEGYDRKTGECKTRYVTPRPGASMRGVWKNDLRYLHDPRRFNIPLPAESAEKSEASR